MFYIQTDSGVDLGPVENDTELFIRDAAHNKSDFIQRYSHITV